MRIFKLSSFEEICAEIGVRLKAIRLAQNMTQSQLAKRAGLSLPSIVRMEQHGRVTFEQIVKVAQLLGVTHTLEALFVSEHATSLDDQIHQSGLTRKRARPKLTKLLKDTV